MHSNEFEKLFSDFLDGQEYDDAANALFAIVRSSFAAGWKAAGGEPPSSKNTVELLCPDFSKSKKPI